MVEKDVPADPADIDWAPVFAHLPWLQDPDAEFGQMIAPAELADGGQRRCLITGYEGTLGDAGAADASRD